MSRADNLSRAILEFVNAGSVEASDGSFGRADVVVVVDLVAFVWRFSAVVVPASDEASWTGLESWASVSGLSAVASWAKDLVIGALEGLRVVKTIFFGLGT